MIPDAASPKDSALLHMTRVPNINFICQTLFMTRFPQYFTIAPIYEMKMRIMWLLMDLWINEKDGSTYFSCRIKACTFRFRNISVSNRQKPWLTMFNFHREKYKLIKFVAASPNVEQHLCIQLGYCVINMMSCLQHIV